jgi:lysophospholipase
MLSAQIEAVPTCRAVIISAYGSGNLPISERSGMLDALRKAVEREILVVVLSQCTLIAGLLALLPAPICSPWGNS